MRLAVVLVEGTSAVKGLVVSAGEVKSEKRRWFQSRKGQLLVMKKVERAVLLQLYNNQWRRDSAKGRRRKKRKGDREGGEE